MTFAAPLFLLAALAAAIPVVLHLINRQRAKELPFPTLRFLKVSAQKTRRRKRVEDLLLMLLRAAVLLLVALGLARPAVTRLNALWGGAQTAVVIVLDNSMSMGAIDADRMRLETARAAALQILDQLGDGDQAALLPTCGPQAAEDAKLDRTQDAVRQSLGQCRVEYQRADLEQTLRKARELLEKSDAPNRQIYLLTDMQRVSWGDVPKSQSPPVPLPPSPFPVIVVDCSRASKPNAAVQSLDIEAALPVTGLPMQATVALRNTAAAAQNRVVELWIDGAKYASSPELSVPPLGRAKHGFTFSFDRGGLHRGEARLAGDDGSKYDDRRFFAIEIDRGVPVAVVKSRRHEIAYLDDAYYLEKALAAGREGSGAVAVTSLLADDLPSEPLEKYKVVYCVNLPALSAEAAGRLAAYLSNGGRVVWLCGDNVVPDAYNRMNEQAGGRLLPAALVDVGVPNAKDNRDSWRIGFLDKKHPALARLVEPPSLYESVLVFKRVRMAAADSATSVLARLDDGEPLLVERQVDKGRVLMLGTAPQTPWSNLPLRPIFLPLIAQLTFELAEVEQARADVIAGRPLVYDSSGDWSIFRRENTTGGQTSDRKMDLSPSSTSGSSEVEVVPPGGERLRLKCDGKTPFRYAGTFDIGVYVLRRLNAPSARPAAYSVNFDPEEAEPAAIDRKELEERLGGAPVVFAENADDLSSTFALLREGKSLWTAFLTAVLVALVFETFLSNRFGGKKKE